MSVISIEDFKNRATKIISINGFDEGDMIEVRVKPLSFFSMLTNGKMPNELLATVSNLFGADPNNINEQDILQNTDDLKAMSQLVDIACEECLVEPRYQDIKEYLSDSQKNEIFTQSMGTVRSAMPSIQK